MIVLQNQPQGYILSYFYRLLRTLPLSRVVVKFSLKHLYIRQTGISENFKFVVIRLLKNAFESEKKKKNESKHFYLCPRENSPPEFSSSPPTRGKLLIPTRQHLFENIFLGEGGGTVLGDRLTDQVLTTLNYLIWPKHQQELHEVGC